ncbi:MAG TPA: tRNA (adenosine(37)-N6)-threonylcarbamoyltransferase complex ATPase subunit type 1 TsaE [Candidatus Ruthenibacterium avium]|uniref:tRNA threonylcarbamoyladenosine biosynthesis protein TsaE n=1 Tax=Candidatus Ruthenibacterium avium TaxID=2838751 RepID=A0A9D2M437_9FIRM|nr:tRNA (adenosine(37)-N6)-threonylcarbamoyltransferase complex ATPase subunit type 1 TsaE [Candidatus Ruthenibacterium avium]
MASYVTHSKEETMRLAARLAQTLAPGTLVLFSGGLGAGKTAFCEGLARGLGCTDEVSSPTFSIVNVYRGKQPLAHFDLYRIHTREDLMTAGFYDYLDEGMVVAAEWSENFTQLFEDEDAVRVHMEYLGDNERRITVEGSALE